MATLSKQAILSASDQRIEKHAVPEWGGEVYLRSIRGWERDKLDQEIRKEDQTHLRAKIVALCLCDETGNSLEFSEAEVLELSAKSVVALGRLADACMALCGLGKKPAEEAEKNSTGPNSSSG